jgi:three-Cys-motif partner protein
MTDVESKERAQKFGGPWSLIKVELVEKYLHAFNTALRRKPTPNDAFIRVYIDTFAGSGSFTFGDDLPLIEEDEAARIFEGSVKRALATKPPFDELYFIEQDAEKVASLKVVAGDDHRVKIIQGDANKEVPKLLASVDWRMRRGVIFVDPCGPEGNWDMIRSIAATKALDMWWLFPISAVYRNAPRDPTALTSEKRAMVARCLDDGDWEKCLYRTKPAATQSSLFPDDSDAYEEQDRIPVGQIEALVTDKLKNIFPHVENPAPLYGPTRAQLFSFFFAVSNPSGPAIAAASSIARDLLKKL